MAPPLQEAADAPVVTTVPESENTTKVLPHADPVFYEMVQRLEEPSEEWTLYGPEFADGTKPVFKIDWRLGEALMGMLLQHSNVKLSRSQRKELEQGGLLTKVRLVKKINPTAVNKFGDKNSGGVHTENTIH